MGVDPTTFVTKDAVLSFYIDLNKGEEKRRIKGLILQGGGELSKDYNDAVLVITDKGIAASDSKIFLPKSYVDDSVSFGQQVFQDYALGTTPPKTISPDRFSGRVHYSQADDNKILNFVNSHSNLSTNGNTLWQEAEKTKVTKHSWMSMRSHYLKVLHPKTVNGNKTLQKKTKSFTDDDTSNLYNAFTDDKAKTTTTTTTTTSTTKTTPIPSPSPSLAPTVKATTKSTSSDKKSNKHNEVDDKKDEDNEEDASAPSVDFNTSPPSDQMEELLEHLLTSEDTTTKKKKKEDKPKTKTNTKNTPSSSSSSKTPQSKATTNGSQKSNGNTTKQTLTPTVSMVTPLQTPATSSSPSSISSSSKNHTPSSQQSSTNPSSTSSSQRKPLYSAGKKRAATEQNMRGNAKRVRTHMEQIAQKLGLPQAVVYHAYILHSGDSVKARKYLTATLKQGESEPWLPHEDKILSGSHNSEQLEQLIKRHGKEKCIARTNFLDSTGT